MKSITAADLMARNLITFSPDMDIYAAMQTLLKKEISGAPVTDSDGNLVGMLSEKNFLKVLAAEAYDGLPEGKVADYMVRSFETVTPETSIYHIVDCFLNKPFRRVPVIEKDGHLAGLVSQRDVLIAIESMRDNPRLYGTLEVDRSFADVGGVDSAMRRARGQ